MFQADPGLRAKLMGLQGSEKLGEIPAAEVAGYAHQMLAAERAGLGPAQAASQETELGKQAWRAGQAAVMGEEAREAMGPVGLIDTHYQRFYKEEADAREWGGLRRTIATLQESMTEPNLAKAEGSRLVLRGRQIRGIFGPEAEERFLAERLGHKFNMLPRPPGRSKRAPIPTCRRRRPPSSGPSGSWAGSWALS